LNRSSFVAAIVAMTALFAPSARGQAPDAPPLTAGVAKVDITDTKALPINDPLYVKALVLKRGAIPCAVPISA